MRIFGSVIKIHEEKIAFHNPGDIVWIGEWTSAALMSDGERIPVYEQVQQLPILPAADERFTHLIDC